MAAGTEPAAAARFIRVRGIVQGVGFRPFVFRLARANALTGWVLNEETGVEIHLEGPEPALDAFLRSLESQSPAAARIASVEVSGAELAGFRDFTIRESECNGRPSTRISPDLPVCADCLDELFDSADPRYLYPYINCTNCGPRYTVIESLPYDRVNTTMKAWPLDGICSAQYHDPADRRFHAQPVACPACGPHFRFQSAGEEIAGDSDAIAAAVRTLNQGGIVAIKGIGGYHLSCDAANAAAVAALRDRKFRKEKPFAVMARTVGVAGTFVDLTPAAEALLTSAARPIVLAPAKIELPGIAPDNNEIGVMLPYAPLHHLLFNAGAPDVLVMTSANRSSEPIAYRDYDALDRLSGLADAFLLGERPIARRVDDSVARAGSYGPVILRRARGYAPGAVAQIPTGRPLLAVGADLKNAVTLVVNGQAFVSQHIGDLDHYDARVAFEETIRDLVSMYGLDWNELLVVHDSHPQYISTVAALQLPAKERRGVQHHRAHIASVVAEREAWDQRVAAASFDGTGYGDDGLIWGGEFFAGSLSGGFERVMYLRKAALPGGDAAARFPVQCAAGFLGQMEDLPDVSRPPFRFPARYAAALEIARKNVRTFETTSMGRLFDAAAALLGFVRETSFEGQAAMWLEHIARASTAKDAYPFPISGSELDWRPLLAEVARERALGKDASDVARAFQRSIAQGLFAALAIVCETHCVETVVLSGGVFQNELLLEDIRPLLDSQRIRVWTNSAVPTNDGGISLGQAAMGAFSNA